MDVGSRVKAPQTRRRYWAGVLALVLSAYLLGMIGIYRALILPTALFMAMLALRLTPRQGAAK